LPVNNGRYGFTNCQCARNQHVFEALPLGSVLFCLALLLCWIGVSITDKTVPILCRIQRVFGGQNETARRVAGQFGLSEYSGKDLSLLTHKMHQHDE